MRREARTWRLALATARRTLATLQPYWSAGVRSLCPVECAGLGTVGVTERGVLMVDPDIVLAWPSGVLPGVLVHEYLHIWFRDPQRRGSRDPRRWNLAADLRINAAIRRSGLPLPDGGCFPEQFGLPDGLTAEQYYELLTQQQQQPQPQPGQGEPGKPGDEPGDSQGRDRDGGDPSPSPDRDRAPGSPQDSEAPLPWETGDEQPGDGQPGDGQPGDGQPGKEPQPGDGQPRGGWHGKGDGSGAGGEPLPGEQEANDAAGGGQSEARLEGLRRTVAKAIKEHAASYGQGSGAGGWGVYADELLQPPKVNWQDKLRHVVRGAAAHQAGAVDYTYRRPSRRQAGCGYGAGHAVVAGLHAPVPRVVVLEDSSGSMGTAQHRRALAEVGGVLRTLQADVTLYCADTEVHGKERLRSIADLRRVELRGGGGTDFGGPLSYVMAHERPKPDVIIYLTDGYGDFGPERHDVTVIWAIVGAGPTPPWGHHVEVEL